MYLIDSYGRSDIGLVRSNNEDTFIVKPDMRFVAVADGMGGSASGEVASKIFIETSLEFFSKSLRDSECDMSGLIRKTFQTANERILKCSEDVPEHRGMGCTAELLTFDNTRFYLGHVGDSRTYVFRDGLLRQITKDHSLVQDQIDQGLIDRVEAKRHEQRNIILRAVGINEVLAVDIIRGEFVQGDVFLLCSDGLTDMVDDDAISEVLSLEWSLERKSEQLIELAKDAGGHDNITVVLCETG